MLECKNATWRQLLIQRNHKTTLGVCAGLSFTSSEQLYSSESPSSHQCVRILSCHLICSNYFFYLLQLFFICNNYFLFAAFSFNLQQLFYLQHVPCGPPYVMMSLPLIGTYFSVFFFLHSHWFTLRTDWRKSDSSEIFFNKCAQYFGLTWIWR